MSVRNWHFGLIGYPLEHSFSPRLHRAALQDTGLSGDYRLLPVPPLPDGSSALEHALDDLRALEFDGLNVTIPHKRSVLPYMAQLSRAAEAVGAVNTILRLGENLVGDNTDAAGFLADLRSLGLPDQGKAVILGAGGAARAAAIALLFNGWRVILAARRLEQADEAVSELATAAPRDLSEVLAGEIGQIDACRLADVDQAAADCDLIVNATPAGMHPDIDSSPWPDGLPLPARPAVYDMVYNPQETRLVREARSAGLAARGGLGMLVEQAALSFEAWTGVRPSRQAMRASVLY